MSSQNEQLDYMLAKALAYQQEFYELLPDWTVYKRDDIKYLKQNIGYAIFGPPLIPKNSISNSNLNSDEEIIDLISYGPNAKKTINLITDQITKHGWIPGNDIIKCGIIYLLLIDHNSFAQSGKDKEMEHIAFPLFKISKYNNNKNLSKERINHNDYTTWYIDVKGRIYKDWDNFMTTNDLPKCIMVFPKDGYYQPDPAYSITSNQSFVWVVAKDSYACSERAKVYSTINTTMNIGGAIATVGISAASVFTPAAPIMAAGLLVTGVSGIWSIGTNAADLYDKSIHEESISLSNKSALSAWLGIAGCTIGLGVNFGGFYITKSAMSGSTVGRFAKTAYNTALVGSISVNLIGLGYQGFHMYEKFQETRTIDMQDVFYFGTHLLFFTNSVVNVKFANGIIEMTQGKILREYEASLREDNLRKHYTYIKNKAAATTTDKIEQNASIIRQINKFNTSHISTAEPVNNSVQISNNVLTIEQYKLKWNGITLIDPLLFIADLAKAYVCRTVIGTSKGPSASYSSFHNNQLERILEKLLGDFYTSRDCPKNNQLYGIPDFKVIIDELKKVKHSEDILPFIFNIALILVKKSNTYAYLIEACHFVWDYIKKNMSEAGLAISSKFCTETSGTCMQQIRAIVGALFEAIDSLINRFLNAFHQYIKLTKNLSTNNSSV